MRALQTNAPCGAAPTSAIPQTRPQMRVAAHTSADAASRPSRGNVLTETLQRVLVPGSLALAIAVQAACTPASVLAESLPTQDSLEASREQAAGPAAVATPQAGAAPEVADAVQEAISQQDSPPAAETASPPASDSPAEVTASAESEVIQAEAVPPSTSQQVALELEVNGQPAGRVVIRTFSEPPLGSRRFLDLARRQGGGYRLSRVDGISDAFVTLTGVLQLNYPGMPEVTGGETVEELEAEQEVYPRSHDRPGLVSLVLLDAVPKDVRERVVAYQGKLVKVQEVKSAGNANGTGLAITLGSAPELDRTNLVIGEVVEGLDVIESISKLPKVKSSSGSPFFKVAKALGDRRADVAARSFGKPLGKVVVRNVSVLD